MGWVSDLNFSEDTLVQRTHTPNSTRRPALPPVPPPRVSKAKTPQNASRPPTVNAGSPMMFEGALTVRWINGRNGEFAVGELKTSIDATFKIKDSLLDQFDEGTYTGRFWISAIYPTSYSAGGRITVEVRATLVDLQIDEESEPSQDEVPTPSEPDPVDEPPQQLVAPVAPAPPAKPKPKAAPEVVDQVDDEALFGSEIFDLVKQRLALKLDPTIGDRTRFRQQCDRLKKLYYEFDAKAQQWLPPQ